MARITGKSGFKLRSGNKPTFAKMGSSPANMRNFGIGKGISPYKNNPYAEAKKKDPNLDQHIKNRDKYEPGSEEYEKYQALVNKAYGKERDQDLKKKQIANVEKEKTNVDKKNEDLKADDLNTEKEIVKKKPRTLEKIAKIGVAALTSGLDAVYGTGKVQFAPGGTRLTTKKVDNDKKNKSLLDKEKEIDEKLS